MSAQRRILVTSALPYANGHIHIGHLVEYLQTDIWVRFQKMRGHDCRYFCADDTHGTAITLRARQEGRSEEEIIASMSAAHQADFAAFDIVFDHYGSTNSPTNRALCEEIWQGLRAQDMITERRVSRFYDSQAACFLADRFVKGGCPKCGAKDQYGDSCDRCGATYAATDLQDPYSVLTGSCPELKESPQLFVQIEKMHDFLAQWISNDRHVQAEVANYLKGHFLCEALHDWDVSRPAPYFGFEIPDAPGNYWYVWFDAPIGYIASCKEWCEQEGVDFSQWWGREQASNANTEIHHFIGKDIQYFHTLFWPAMLKAAGFKLPNTVRIHGFLTVDGEKMSKSKGTFIAARTYLEHLDPAWLRYYYASKLSAKVDDLDLNLEDFVQKINSDLVGKVVNLASRTARFMEGACLSELDPPSPALAAARAAKETVAEYYEQGNYAAAMREIMAVADRANEAIEAEKPWVLAKDPDRSTQLHAVCSQGLAVFYELAIMLGPVLPGLLDATARLFSQEHMDWQSSPQGAHIASFERMMQRADSKAVQAMIDASVTATATVESAPSACQSSQSLALDGEAIAAEISIDMFSQVDLRVAEILEAEAVEGSEKLLRLQLGLGGDERRQVFAGIAKAYQPQELCGRLVVMVANLTPRKMRFGLSEGMLCAVGSGKNTFLIQPDSGARPGMRVS